MKLLKPTIVLLLSIFIFGRINGNELTQLSGPFLGQKMPGHVPEKFANGLISTDAWEAAGTFAPDMNTFFYTWRESYSSNKNRLRIMEQIKGKWTFPRVPNFASDQFMESEPHITPDGKRVYFNSNKPKPKGVSGKGELWYSDKIKNGWSKAKYLDSPINDGWNMYITSTKDGTLYFTGHFNKKFGIFRSVLSKGKYLYPEYVSSAVNDIGGASHPYISPDETYMIFDGQPNEPRKTALYISFKQNDGKWTKAIKLNKEINLTKTEMIASVSPDGKYFFFYREGDIYWMKADFIKKLMLKVLIKK